MGSLRGDATTWAAWFSKRGPQSSTVSHAGNADARPRARHRPRVSGALSGGPAIVLTSLPRGSGAPGSARGSG